MWNNNVISHIRKQNKDNVKQSWYYIIRYTRCMYLLLQLIYKCRIVTTDSFITPPSTPQKNAYRMTLQHNINNVSELV